MSSENRGAQEDKLLALERIYGADEVRKAESDLSKEEKPRSMWICSRLSRYLWATCYLLELLFSPLFSVVQGRVLLCIPGYFETLDQTGPHQDPPALASSVLGL